MAKRKSTKRTTASSPDRVTADIAKRRKEHSIGGCDDATCSRLPECAGNDRALRNGKPDRSRSAPAAHEPAEQESEADLKQVTVQAHVDLDDLSNQLVDACEYDTLFEFVKSIDNGVADFDFTKRLAVYFTKVVKDNEE